MDVAPVIDVGPLARGRRRSRRRRCGRERDRCRVPSTSGSSSSRATACPPTSRAASSPSARSFFILPEADREAMAMHHGGAAWRGWFPIGGELTSSVPDRKEGIYFGAELGPDDPRVVAGLPLHGPNLFPERLPAMRRGGARVDGRHDRARPSPRAGHRPRSRPRGGDGSTSTSPPIRPRCSASSATRRSTPTSTSTPSTLGGGRAHRLRPAHDPPPGPHRAAWRSGPRTPGTTGSTSRSCRTRWSATSATCSTA